MNTEKLLISMGLFDPVTALGPDSWNPGSSRLHGRTLFISQAGHASDIFVANVTDSQGLTQARLYELGFCQRLACLVIGVCGVRLRREKGRRCDGAELFFVFFCLVWFALMTELLRI